jgi:hypothetical protein
MVNKSTEDVLRERNAVLRQRVHRLSEELRIERDRVALLADRPLSQKDRLSLEIISTDTISGKVVPVSGWGRDAERVELVTAGKFREVCLSRDGERQVGLRIGDDGSLHLTFYRMHYTQAVDTNTTLRPQRPWPCEGATDE